MSVHPLGDWPGPPRVQAKVTSGPPGTAGAGWARALFSHPSPVAALLWAVDAVAVASVLPLRPWSSGARLVLVVAVGVAAGCAALRLILGGRLASWSLHVDVGLANLLVSAVAGAGASGHVGLANLYLLVALFALLYLPLPPALGHLGAAGAAYALVLCVGPRPADQPLAAWLAVFGTAAACGAVVVGLASVLRRTAREDPLTGLANRRSFDERLDEELERARRAGCPLSVVVADLDGFKALNDALGHSAGDRRLCDLATRWHDTVRDAGDLLARLGGDEFALLAPGTDEAGSHRLVDRLAAALPTGVRASFGAATWDHTEHASDLVRRADRAMYHAKRRRRRDGAATPS